jgi:hypothetical protein
MVGKGLSCAYAGLQDYLMSLQIDHILRDCVTLSLITFSDVAELVIINKPIITLTLDPLVMGKDGNTKYSAAIDMALELVRSLKSDFQRGKSPLLVFVSDGQNNPDDAQDFEAALQRMNEDPFLGRKANGEGRGYRVIAGAGDKIDSAQLLRLIHDSQKGQVVALTDLECLKPFFLNLRTITSELASGAVKSCIQNDGAVGAKPKVIIG